LSTIGIATGTLSSRILGLIRDMTVAALFGRGVTDAWLVAFRIPNLARRIFGEGSLTASFLPVFVSLKVEDGKKGNERRDLANAVHLLLVIALGMMTALGIVFAESVVSLLAPGFEADVDKFGLTIRLAKIMMVFILLVCLYAYYMAILNSHKKFLLPAFAPALLNVGIISFCFMPQNWFAFSGEALGWGVVFGGSMQLALVMFGLIRIHEFPSFSKNIFSASVKKVFARLIPSVLGMGVLQLGVLINTRFASQLEEGSNSWIFWADRLLEFPLSLVAVSMGTALLPSLSEYHSSGKKEKMLDLMNRSLRYIFYISVPAGVALYILSTELVTLFYKRGQFSSVDVHNTAQVLSIYGAAIFSYASIRILQPGFYAVQNTWLPAVISFLSLVLHYFVAQELMERYGIYGLALSSVISATVNLVALLTFYQILIGSIYWWELAKSITKILLASSAMAYFLVLTKEAMNVELALGKVYFLLVCVVGGAGVYFASTLILKSPEISLLKNRFARNRNQ
ncbi:MAG: murein biosynthesis integral membrane protein MurJ, partial [Bdellovibrionales bacterium]|nr:murein biosynthesis integral membrane protein MurJ [Bdellovibrionales bacterium]